MTSIPTVNPSKGVELSTPLASPINSAEMLKDLQFLLLLTSLSSMGLDKSGSNSSSLFGNNLDILNSFASSGGNNLSSLFSQVFTSAPAVTQSLAGMSEYTGRSAVQINQFDAEKQVGGDGINSNCGPTSLVMALRRIGLKVDGETDGMSDGKVVDLARKSMAASGTYDGVTARGKRVEAEHNVYTDFDDLSRGAIAAGASARVIDPDSGTIGQAVKSGASVIISGTFIGKSPLPWTGDRGKDNHSAPGNAGNHIVLVSGYNSATGTFTINDPARNSSLQVSSKALERFLAGNAGAIAISR